MEEDKKILDSIKKSAESLPIPDSLKPDNLDNILKDTAFAEKNSEQDMTEDTKMTDKKKKITSFYKWGGAIAAALVLVVGITAWVQLGGGNNKSAMDMTANSSADMDTTESVTAESEELNSEDTQVAENSAEVSEESAADMTEEVTLGGVLTQASDYQEIYEKYASIQSSAGMYARDGVVEYGAAADGEASISAQAETAGVESASSQDNASAAGSADFSQTNIRTEGVEEGDTVKTDGTYLYVLDRNTGVRIVKANAQESQLIKDIPLEQTSGYAREMYLYEKRLIVIVDGVEAGIEEAEEEDVFDINQQQQTTVYTYNIENPEEPKLLGQVSQGGFYHTSRLVDGYLYVLTEDSRMLPYAKTYGVEDTNSFVPSVNGEVMAADDIYMPNTPDNGTYLVMTSVKITSPAHFIDTKAVMAMPYMFYVSNSNIYVNGSGWNQTASGSTIVRIAFKNGKIKPEAAGWVKGYLNDSFSMDEYQGYLRVLTTDYVQDATQNALYILDEDLQVTGKLENLAEGEHIESARLLDDIGYFVTYKQTDPLFSVDLSDPANPAIIGSLKVNGFSEYLHFYGANQLLGIGWETNPDTQERIGLKLSMYDISDPENVTEIHKKVIEGIGDVTALYNYKGFLINPDKNIIGFTSQTWKESGSESNYMVFSYDKDQGFTQNLSYKFQAEGEEEYMDVSDVRGVYIGNELYITRYDQMEVFKIDEDYAQIAVFDWN
ncbi:MAG: beta-propeller domain-containing protein [Lachnospiraceae bacterium]|nr:beta-propeller domain-containing protein [Lachnospiraceae bacterium]